jgi:hypothetical protein
MNKTSHPHNGTPQQPHPAHGKQEEPVAYDREGRPLYLQPGQQPPNLVYMAKPIDPIQQPISPRILERHKQSMEKYPELNLSKGEYVISAVRRHPIGLLRIWFAALVIIFALLALLVMFVSPDGAAQDVFTSTDVSAVQSAAIAGLGIMTVLVILGAMVATYVYNANRFFLTNESVIQEIQTSLFSKREQTVSLANIEDASFHQGGIIPSIFDYADIRLSTEGDETTYRFSYASHPKRQISLLNNAVEAFKNGRPVDPEEEERTS